MARAREALGKSALLAAVLAALTDATARVRVAAEPAVAAARPAVDRARAAAAPALEKIGAVVGPAVESASAALAPAGERAAELACAGAASSSSAAASALAAARAALVSASLRARAAFVAASAAPGAQPAQPQDVARLRRLARDAFAELAEARDRLRALEDADQAASARPFGSKAPRARGALGGIASWTPAGADALGEAGVWDAQGPTADAALPPLELELRSAPAGPGSLLTVRGRAASAGGPLLVRDVGFQARLSRALRVVASAAGARPSDAAFSLNALAGRGLSRAVRLGSPLHAARRDASAVGVARDGSASWLSLQLLQGSSKASGATAAVPAAAVAQALVAPLSWLSLGAAAQLDATEAPAEGAAAPASSRLAALAAARVGKGAVAHAWAYADASPAVAWCVATGSAPRADRAPGSGWTFAAYGGDARPGSAVAFAPAAPEAPSSGSEDASSSGSLVSRPPRSWPNLPTLATTPAKTLRLPFGGYEVAVPSVAIPDPRPLAAPALEEAKAQAQEASRVLAQRGSEAASRLRVPARALAEAAKRRHAPRAVEASYGLGVGPGAVFTAGVTVALEGGADGEPLRVAGITPGVRATWAF